MLLACHTGDVAKAESRLWRPIKAFGKPVGDILQRRPYVTQQSLLDATQPRGRRYYWKSEYLPGIESEVLAKVAEHAARITLAPLRGHRVPARWGGGAIGRTDHSAVGNRDAGGRAQHHGGLGEGGGRRDPRRVGPLDLARHAPLLDRRHLRQLPDRGGDGRAPRGRLREQPGAARRAQGPLGPDEPLPDEQERRCRRQLADADRPRSS